MDNKNKKEDILQTLQSTTDEQLIEEVYELLHPDEAIDNITITDLPQELTNQKVNTIRYLKIRNKNISQF